MPIGDTGKRWPCGGDRRSARSPTRLWARPYATRLEELRLAATEEQIELGLTAGRHADLVAELASLVSEFPTRERLHGQLMLALYRSGRQVEALAAYQKARVRLSDELGLDPSTELRQLEQAILRHDPLLSVPGTASTGPAVHLPARVASIVGQAETLDRARELLGEHRLLTLSGPGGVGKTTVAIEVATVTAADHPDGVFLVRLAGITEPARVSPAVADALGLGAASSSGDALVRFLRDRAALVVLDNCEHLADACAALAQRLLSGCPRLRLLATSREPMGVPGEVQLLIPPLKVPPTDGPPVDVMRYDAARLFVERARAINPELSVDPDALAAVARICRALDGIPLALELAAALVRSLGVGDIAAHLDDRFRLLVGGPRTADARQQTLRATVDWSHRLLTEPERVLWRRLAVFRGGWSLAAAQRVCAGHGLDPADILGLLVRLVDRSLVVADPARGGRFRLLETMRHFAQEQLEAAGEAARLAAAHAADLLAVAEAAEADLRGPGQRRWLHWMRTEQDNLNAALRWCRAHATSDPDVGLRLAAALGWFSYFASRPAGAQDIAGMLAAAPGGSAEAHALALQAQALVARPSACVVHPSSACAAAARASLSLFVDLGQSHRAAYSRTFLAVEGVGATDGAEARALLVEAAAEFERVEDRWGQALVEFVRMDLRYAGGEFTAATGHAEKALSLFEDVGDHWGKSAIRFHAGRALHRVGRLDEAARLYGEALAEGRQVGLANTVQYALAHLGHVMILLGDDARAAGHFAQAHAVARDLGAAGNPLASLGEAVLARGRGDLGSAREHYLITLAFHDGQPSPGLSAAAHTGLGFVAELSGDLGEAEHQHHAGWALASEDTTPDAVHSGAAATALEGLACVAASRGDGDEAGTPAGCGGAVAPASPTAGQRDRALRHRPGSRPCPRPDRRRRLRPGLLGGPGVIRASDQLSHASRRRLPLSGTVQRRQRLGSEPSATAPRVDPCLSSRSPCRACRAATAFGPSAPPSATSPTSSRSRSTSRPRQCTCTAPPNRMRSARPWPPPATPRTDDWLTNPLSNSHPKERRHGLHNTPADHVSCPSPMGPDAHRGGPVHGHHGHLDHRRRAAADAGRPRVHPRRACQLGLQRLRRRVRRPAAPRRPALGPVRRPPHLRPRLGQSSPPAR